MQQNKKLSEIANFDELYTINDVRDRILTDMNPKAEDQKRSLSKTLNILKSEIKESVSIINSFRTLYNEDINKIIKYEFMSYNKFKYYWAFVDCITTNRLSTSEMNGILHQLGLQIIKLPTICFKEEHTEEDFLPNQLFLLQLLKIDCLLKLIALTEQHLVKVQNSIMTPLEISKEEGGKNG